MVDVEHPGSEHPHPHDRTTLAERVRGLRRARAWSQEQLAEAAALSLRTVQRIERGAPAAPETVQALAGALDVPAAELAACAPERRKLGSHRVLGLDARAAAVAGLALSAPAVLFAAANVGEYVLGWRWAGALFPHAARGLLASPVVLLGGALAAFLLAAARLVAPHGRREGRALRIEGVTLVFDPAAFAVAALAAASAATLLGYATLENLGDMIAGAAG